MKRFRRWFFYLAYTLVAVGLFLYLLFPAESFKSAVLGHLSKSLPDYQVQIGQIRPFLPLGLGIEALDIAREDRFDVQIDALKLSPKFTTLLSPSKTIRFHGRAYSGDLEGRIDFSDRDDGLHAEIMLKLAGVRVDEIPDLQKVLERKLSGSLNGIVTVVSEPGSGDSIKGNLVLADARLAFDNPFIKVTEIALDDVRADFNLNKRVFSLKRLEASGGQVTGNLAGTLMIRKPFENSRLNLRGSFRPEETLMAGMQGIVASTIFQKMKAGTKGLPVRIYGTVAKPRFSFR